MGKIWMIRRDFWQLVLAAVIFVAGAAAAHAQGFGGGVPTTEESFNRIDRNGSGAIEPEEWETLPPPIRRIYEDLADLSVPMDYDDFADVSQKMREQMMSRFGGGRGMQFGGGGGDSSRRDRSGDGSDESGRRGDDGGSRRSRGGGRGFGGTDDDSSATAGNSDKKPEKASGKVTKPRTPINLKLPEQYRARDKDRDGQIGLYEWSRSDYSGFQKLDRNGDGFLTPQELLRAGGGGAASRTSSSSGSTSGDGGSAGGAAPADATSQSSPAANAGPDARAETAFKYLDKNNDGSVSEEEWKKSLSARPTFEKAGIQVSLPMSKKEFIRLFPQAYPPAGK